jgi:hypothetical protein
MNKFLTLLAATILCRAALAADPGHFAGKVVVEWLDDPFIPSMRLQEDFSFQDARGKKWLAPKDAVLDGRSLPPVFRMRSDRRSWVSTARLPCSTIIIAVR